MTHFLEGIVYSDIIADITFSNTIKYLMP